jgi:acetyl/propionyl-CoA carboxylase alpha subunit
MIKRLLVANRGEIAVRVMRTAREMGIETVAVYSDADRDAMHVQMADRAVHIGESEPGKSYLSIEKIIDAARETSADAIHPGYGFLSERAEFAEACAEAGITFVGPSATAMRRLGAKIDAKQIAVAASVPVVPGMFEPGASDAQLKEAATKIGYPVLLKASAGGGGRGMRAVRNEAEFDDQIKLAREESIKAFGDGAMMVEKLVEQPRHIEVQILSDTHGNVACLFERECSIQRRHQKIIEEAPSPVMTDELWARMKAAAESLIRKAEYVGAGTVEFMTDFDAREFFFLEVNARLQVEHPVTEAITGLDLVRQQLLIADGKPMEVSPALMAGDRTAIRGHAIEARLVAEDPGAGFLPSVGKLLGWAEPSGLGVRFDTGFGAGREISRFYDSLIAKLIVHAETRDAAIAKLEMALEDTHILGVKTNIAYILDVIRSEEFRAGDTDTGLLGRSFADWKLSSEIPAEIAALLSTSSNPAGTGTQTRFETRPAWAAGDGFRVTRIPTAATR